MDKKILLPVDGSKKGLESIGIIGKLLKDQENVGLVLYHCVPQLMSLMPSDLCMDIQGTCKLAYQDQQKMAAAVLEESVRALTDAGYPSARIEKRLRLDSQDPATDIMNEAAEGNLHSIAMGRRGRGQLGNLLLGSVSAKVAQYARNHSVWIVDAPVHASGKVMVAMEGSESRALVEYVADHFGAVPGVEYSLIHLMPPVPPTFWDDGHILGSSEQKDRQSRIDKWRSDWTARMENEMAKGKEILVGKGVASDKVESYILSTKEGVARDLLNEIDKQKFQVVVMGKKSLHERKPFLMGSHANKILQNVKETVLCLVEL